MPTRGGEKYFQVCQSQMKALSLKSVGLILFGLLQKSSIYIISDTALLVRLRRPAGESIAGDVSHM